MPSWAGRYFPRRYFAGRYWPDGPAAPGLGGIYWTNSYWPNEYWAPTYWPGESSTPVGPTAIASAEAFGTATLLANTILVPGIPSEEAFGTGVMVYDTANPPIPGEGSYYPTFRPRRR